MHTRFLASLVALALAGLTSTSMAAADTPVPAPPSGGLSALVKKLAEKRAAETGAAKLTKEQLLKPEFRFTPTANWLLLPDLARQLTTNDTEREAILALMDQGAREARKLFAAEAEGADRDVAAATALFITELWKVVRQQELPEANADALHAQIVGALAGPETGKMSDAEKQKYWEFCVGFPVFVLGMKEVATEAAAQKDLRQIAASVFASLIGVNPELVDLGPQGMVVRAGLEEAAKEIERENAAPPPTVIRAPGSASADPTQVKSNVSRINYTPPPGWTEEKAAWATIYRATLFDTTEKGEPEPHREARHAGSIFVLPPRAITQDVQTTFEAVWKEQLTSWELGDAIVHYRSRLNSGLVVHYMGRFLKRKNAAPNQLNDYAVVYLVDLGGGRVQPITAVAVPNDPGLGMGSFKETAAYRSLSWPLAAMLHSITPEGGPAPYPRGGYFAADDLRGNWRQSSSTFGGMYYNTVTGMGAGAAVHSSSGTFRLSADGTYAWSLAYSTYNPQWGSTADSDKHEGTYTLDGDIVLVKPSKPTRSKFTCCATGIGRRQTPQGVKRILVTVSANQSGAFVAPPLVPNWDSYSGVLSWYQED